MKKIIITFAMVFFIGLLNAEVTIQKAIKSKTVSKTMPSKTENNSQNGTTTTVGSDSQCAFDSIQVAIDSGVSEVRVANNMVYAEKISLNDISVKIRGGFTDCVQATNNNQSSMPSVIDHTGLNVGAIIAITGNILRNTIVLENLHLTGATSSGIETSVADVEVFLENVLISNNQISNGGVGGGIAIFSGNTDILLNDTIIKNNVAEFGGGIYCDGSDTSVNIAGASGVSLNSAIGVSSGGSGNGGGVYVTNGCNFKLFSGTSEINSQTTLGISGNTANGQGGGIYVDNGSLVRLIGYRASTNGVDFFGDNNNPVNISSNISDADNSGSERGGGVYLTGENTKVFIYAGLVENNRSPNGGGVYVNDKAELKVQRLGDNCWNKVRCNFFNGNIAIQNRTGGAIQNDQGSIDIVHTVFEDNQAGSGTALYVFGAQSVNIIDGSIFNHNSKSNNSLIDKFVIRAAAGAIIQITHSTFADNDVQESVFGVTLDATISLISSIIHESSGLVLNDNHGATIMGCLIVHDASNLFGNEIIVADPEFINRNNRDYHLNAGLSPAIDYCTLQGSANAVDIDNEARGLDDPNVANLGNSSTAVYDIGADEVYDIIFLNGFD